MKTCPYCANEIQDAAIKCQYCNEFLADAPLPPLVEQPPTPRRRAFMAYLGVPHLLALVGLAAVAAGASASLPTFEGGLVVRGAMAVATFSLLCWPFLQLAAWFRRFTNINFFSGANAMEIFWQKVATVTGPYLVAIAAAAFGGLATASVLGDTFFPISNSTPSAQTNQAAALEPGPESASASILNGDGLPADGSDYEEVKRQLLARKFLAFDAGDRSIDNQHREILRTGEAIFVGPPENGIRNYLIVETTADRSKVSSSRWATWQDIGGLNLPDLQPPGQAAIADRPPWTLANLPLISGDYYSARTTLQNSGFTPFQSPARMENTFCQEDLDDVESTDCEPHVVLSEVISCTGGGRAMCMTAWRYKEKVLVVMTAGEPQPGGIESVYWATPDEIADIEQQVRDADQGGTE